VLEPAGLFEAVVTSAVVSAEMILSIDENVIFPPPKSVSLV